MTKKVWKVNKEDGSELSLPYPETNWALFENRPISPFNYSFPQRESEKELSKWNDLIQVWEWLTLEWEPFEFRTKTAYEHAISKEIERKREEYRMSEFLKGYPNCVAFKKEYEELCEKYGLNIQMSGNYHWQGYDDEDFCDEDFHFYIRKHWKGIELEFDVNHFIA